MSKQLQQQFCLQDKLEYKKYKNQTDKTIIPFKPNKNQQDYNHSKFQMGNTYTKQEIDKITGQLAQMDKQLEHKLGTWQKEVKKMNKMFIKYDAQKDLAKEYGTALNQIQTILKGVLSATQPHYATISTALLKTVNLLTKSASAKSKEKEGYYLATAGKGIIRIHYYFFCRQIEAQYLACKQSQTLLAYGYAVAPYEEPFTVQKLGGLIEGMDLSEEEKKKYAISLTKFATDADQLGKMKQIQKEAEDFW